MMVLIIVDGQNLFSALRVHGVGWIDLTAFALGLAGGEEAERHFHIGLPPQGNLGALLGALRHQGWKVFSPRLAVDGSEKEVDVGIAVDLLEAAWSGRFSRAILVSGDGDLAPAVRSAEERGLPVEVVQFLDFISVRLARAASKVRTLDLGELRRYERGEGASYPETRFAGGQ